MPTNVVAIRKPDVIDVSDDITRARNAAWGIVTGLEGLCHHVGNDPGLCGIIGLMHQHIDLLCTIEGKLEAIRK